MEEFEGLKIPARRVLSIEEIRQQHCTDTDSCSYVENCDNCLFHKTNTDAFEKWYNNKIG